MARVANLESGLQVAVDCQNQNAEAFRDALYALEARQWMMMRLSADLAVNEPARDSSGGVDWNHYEALYKTWWEKQKQLEEEQSATVQSDEPQDAVVFGGS